MFNDFFNNNEIIKISLKYTINNNLKKIFVDLFFEDSKLLYFTPSNGSVSLSDKISKKINAELVVYTQNGLFVANVVIKESNYSIDSGYQYIIVPPKKFDFIQLRLSNRENFVVPIKLMLEDEIIVDTVSLDFSTNGVAFLINNPLAPVYKKFPCNMQINLFDLTLDLTVKYVREMRDLESFGDNILCAFKFLNLTCENKKILIEKIQNLNILKGDL